MTDIGRELRATIALGVPLAVVQLVQLLIGTTIIVLSGRLGAQSLAAAALGQSIYFTVWMFGLGLTVTVSPLVARALGAQRHDEPGPLLRQGLWVATAFGVPAIALVYQGEAILLLIGQTPENAALAGQYLRITCFGMVPSLWFGVLRAYTSAHGRTRSVILAVLLGLGTNALVAWTFMFGEMGVAPWGLPGAGLGNIAATSAMFLAMLIHVLRDPVLGGRRPLAGWWRPDWPRFAEIVRVGVPIGGAMLLEVAAFNACLQLMGLIGTAELAAHQIALQLASISFMLPLGIGQAATVRVGWFAGAGQMAAAARAGWMAYALGVGIVAISALLFVVIPRPLIGLFIDAGAAENAAVVAFAVQFLVVVAAFQLVDAAQVVMAGALRGLKDTKVPLLISAIAYWPLGLGLAWALGFHTEWRGVGIWIASAVGLTFAAILLTWRFARLTRHAQAAT